MTDGSFLMSSKKSMSKIFIIYNIIIYIIILY